MTIYKDLYTLVHYFFIYGQSTIKIMKIKSFNKYKVRELIEACEGAPKEMRLFQDDTGSLLVLSIGVVGFLLAKNVGGYFNG